MYPTKLASSQMPIWNILKKRNVDPQTIFVAAGLDPELMQQQGARYSLSKIAVLWHEAENALNDPCFGIEVANSWHPSHFGALGYAMLASKSLRMTLERLIRYFRVISDLHFAELTEQAAENTLTFSLVYSDNEQHPPAREDAALAWVMSTLRVNYQQELAPAGVMFSHDQQSCSMKYYEFFRAPLTFNGASCAIILPLDVADEELPSWNSEMAAFNDQQMEKYLSTLQTANLSSKVKKRIVEHLPSGDATLENVASDLALSTRTLQRMLSQENTGFMQLLEETRKELARGYVSQHTMDLTEIAFLLGFSDLSSFSRSFKRWTGQPPNHYRKSIPI